MTQEELRQMLNLIVSKCDNLINNNLYIADDFTQCNVEDIAEMCNMALDGKFGELPSLPSDLDEAAEKYGNEKHPMTTTGANESAHDFKVGAKWMMGQGETIEGNIEGNWRNQEDTPYEIYLISDYLPKDTEFKFGDEVIVQIRKKQ